MSLRENVAESTLHAVTKLLCCFDSSAKATIESLNLRNSAFFQEEPEPLTCFSVLDWYFEGTDLFLSLTILTETLLRELRANVQYLHGKNDPSKRGRGASIIENSSCV